MKQVVMLAYVLTAATLQAGFPALAKPAEAILSRSGRTAPVSIASSSTALLSINPDTEPWVKIRWRTAPPSRSAMPTWYGNRRKTLHERKHDVWGSALAGWLGVADGARGDTLARTFKANYEELVYRGQVRGLMKGQYWFSGPHDAYQNGGYWGFCSGWFAWTLARVDRPLAEHMLVDMANDYKARGAGEYITRGNRAKGFEPDHVAHPQGYMASVTMPLAAVKRLLAAKEPF